MSFNDLIQSDAQKMIAALDYETVNYKSQGEAAVELQVLVERGDLESQREDHSRTTARPLAIWIAKTALATVSEHEDTVQLAPVRGAQPGGCRFRRSLDDSDDAFWHLAVGR